MATQNGIKQITEVPRGLVQMGNAIMQPEQRDDYNRRMAQEDARRRREEQDQRNRESDMRAYRDRKEKQIAAAANAPISGDSVSYGTQGPKGIGRLAPEGVRPDKFPPSNVPPRDTFPSKPGPGRPSVPTPMGGNPPQKVGWGFRTDANGNSIESGGRLYYVPPGQSDPRLAGTGGIKPLKPNEARLVGTGGIKPLKPNETGMVASPPPRSALQPGGRLIPVSGPPLTKEERWPGGPPKNGPARGVWMGGGGVLDGNALSNPHEIPYRAREHYRIPTALAATASGGGGMPRVVPHIWGPGTTKFKI